jgi:metal-responsive CopG/Arc/MetJ family transcriptional regulator
MESISVKFQENILKKIDKNISKHNFNSRTEFIRDAVRDKLSTLNKEDLIKELMKFRGKASQKTTDEERKKIKEKVSRELMEELETRFK